MNQPFQNGLLVLEDRVYVSPPRSLRALIGPAGALSVEAYRIKNFAGKASRIRLGFSVRLGKCFVGPKDNGGLNFAALGFGAEPEISYISLVTYGSGFNFVQASCSKTSGDAGPDSTADSGADADVGGSSCMPTAFPLAAPDPDKWTQIVMDLKWGPPPTATISYDGTVVLNEKPLTFLPSTMNVASFINLGPNGKGPLSSCTIDFDNVTFDADP